MSSYITKFRLFLFTLLVLVILFLLYKAIVPFGEITYKTTLCNKSHFIYKLKPTDRLKGECKNIITGDPVYFNLNTQRTFDSGEVSITYKSGSTAPTGVVEPLLYVIELGVLADAQKHYKLKPLENKIIDELNWDAVTENGITLLQRERKFENVDEFLGHLPERKKIRTYHYDLPQIDGIPNYGNYLASSKAFPSDNIPKLQGSYQFYTYLDKMGLDYIFKFKNVDKGGDDRGNIQVYYKNDLIKQRDVIAGQEIELTMENRPTGFYKIVVNASDNIITEDIKSTSRIITFINKIKLAKTIEPELINITTDSLEIFARTTNPSSLQKVLINEDILKITETYKQFSGLTNKSMTDIKLAKDGVEIAGDGLFSFTPDAFYNPSYKKINKNTDLNKDKIDYIITTYPPTAPQLGGQALINNWQTRTVTFDLKNSFRYEGAYGFLISIPGLLAEDNIEDYLEIGEIEVKLKGRSLWEKLKNI